MHMPIAILSLPLYQILMISVMPPGHNVGSTWNLHRWRALGKCARRGVVYIVIFQLCGDAEGKNIGFPGICTILCNGQYGTYEAIYLQMFFYIHVHTT
jgi:hypothetical protein